MTQEFNQTPIPIKGSPDLANSFELRFADYEDRNFLAKVISVIAFAPIFRKFTLHPEGGYSFIFNRFYESLGTIIKIPYSKTGLTREQLIEVVTDFERQQSSIHTANPTNIRYIGPRLKWHNRCLRSGVQTIRDA